jgi:DNA-binding response OmpR family regulator
MARVALLCPDLMFGSRVEEALRAAGHEVTRYDVEDVARTAIDGGSDALVLDLTADEFDAAALVESLRTDGRLDGTVTVGFYPHVQQEVRRRADEAGVDVVVPRSRMAREGAAVVEGALARSGRSEQDSARGSRTGD